MGRAAGDLLPKDQRLKIVEFDSTKGYDGEGPSDRWSTPYNVSDAWKWPHIVKYLQELYPDAEPSGVFNVGVSFNRARAGHCLIDGGDDAR